MNTFAVDAKRPLDHLCIAQTVFVGESLSGIIGLKFVHAYPERTHPLGLCHTPCRLPHGELRQRFAAGAIGMLPCANPAPLRATCAKYRERRAGSPATLCVRCLVPDLKSRTVAGTLLSLHWSNRAASRSLRRPNHHSPL